VRLGKQLFFTDFGDYEIMTKSQRIRSKTSAKIKGYKSPDFAVLADQSNPEYRKSLNFAMLYAKNEFAPKRLKAEYVKWSGFPKPSTLKDNDIVIQMLGTYAYIINNGGVIPGKWLSGITKQDEILKEQAEGSISKEVAEIAAKKAASQVKRGLAIKDAMMKKQGLLLEVMEGWIDDENTTENVAKFLSENSVAATTAKNIAVHFTAMKTEMANNTLDELDKGLTAFDIKKVKMWTAVINNIVDGIGNYTSNKKTAALITRRVNAKTKTPAAVRVAKTVKKVKFAPESLVDPKQVIGKQILVATYSNSKYNFVVVYQAKDADGLSFTGTKISNFDSAKSYKQKFNGKKIDIKKEMLAATSKSKTLRELKTLTNTTKPVNGATTASLILLKQDAIFLGQLIETEKTKGKQ